MGGSACWRLCLGLRIAGAAGLDKAWWLKRGGCTWWSWARWNSGSGRVCLCHCGRVQDRPSAEGARGTEVPARVLAGLVICVDVTATKEGAGRAQRRVRSSDRKTAGKGLWALLCSEVGVGEWLQEGKG